MNLIIQCHQKLLQLFATIQRAVYVMPVMRQPQYTAPPASDDLNSHSEWPSDHSTLELVRNISPGTDSLPDNVGVSATFRC